MKNSFVSVIIVAAGNSSRMNMNKNKQYIEICEKPVLARTIQVFENCYLIDEIIIVVRSSEIVYCKKNIIDYFGFKKVVALVAGGENRQHSVYNGLNEVNEACDIVMVHDGARPFIDEEIIVRSINTALEHQAACVGVPVKDTIKLSDNEGNIALTLEREKLWSIQTPQVFDYSLLLNAHIKAKECGFVGTDDSVLVERIGVKVKLVEGSYNNIKITTKEDIVLAEAIINSQEG